LNGFADKEKVINIRIPCRVLIRKKAFEVMEKSQTFIPGTFRHFFFLIVDMDTSGMK